MKYGLGVDLGTTHTAAAVRVGDRLEIVQLGGQRPEIPSVVFVKSDGEMLIGDAADWRGDGDPDRLVREFKRRMGDPVPIMVAGSPYSAHILTARLLRHVVDTVTRVHGQPPTTIAVAHPANWTRFKLDFLSQAVHLADLDDVAFRTEPEAAALQYAATERIRPGETLAVYDLGGGTFDAAVVRKTGTGFELLGTPEGIEHLGGGDFDEAVLDHVTATLGPAFADLDLDDDDVVVGLARLRRDCVRAKENLSFDTETSIQVALPGLHQRVRLNRSELEARIGPPLEQTVAATRRALRSAGVDPAGLRCILLTGGAARVPLVGQLLATAFDRPLAMDAHPEHSVALGSALATGPAPVARPTPVDQPTRVAQRGESAAVGAATTEPAAPGPAAEAGPPKDPTAVRGVAKMGAEPPPERPDTGTRSGKGRRVARQAVAALRTGRGRAATGSAVLAVAIVAALMWWPRAPGDRTPAGPSSPSPPAGPVELFSAPVDGPVETAVAVDSARVYVTIGRTVQAMSRTDGKPAWARPFSAPAEIVAAPQVSGDTLYVPAGDNRLHAVDTADGRERKPITTGKRDPGPPTVAGDALYLGTSGGLFSRYDLPDQRRRWKFQTGNAVRHPPAVASGLVVVSSSDGWLYAFDADKGDDPLWNDDIRPSSAPVIASGRIFVGSGDKKLHAIDARTGRTEWTFPTGAAVESAPAVDGALVHVGGQDGIVYAVEAATGTERWRFPGAAGEKFDSVQAAGGVLYAATRGGRIYALDAATGRLQWKRDVAGRPAPLRLADGVLYVGTSDRAVHALRVAPPAPPAPVATSTAPSRTSPPEPTAEPTTQRTRRAPQHPREPSKRPASTRPSTTPSPTSEPTTPSTTEPTVLGRPVIG